MKYYPKWGREIKKFLSVKQQFVLWGNIYDVYPIEYNNCLTTLKLQDYLKVLLNEMGYEIIISYEPLTGFSLLSGDEKDVKEISGVSISKSKPYKCTLGKSIPIIDKLMSNDLKYCAVLLNFSSRLPEIAGNDLGEFYYEMFKKSHKATPKMISNSAFSQFNLIFWAIDKENDLPDWYSIDNSKIKILPLPKPDFDIRKMVINCLCGVLNGYNDLSSSEKNEIELLFSDQTNGLLASEIVSIVSLAKREGLHIKKISESIRMYKLGITENPWSKLNMDNISNAEDILSKRVKGQSRAVKKASDVIKRAVYNLSGSQYSKYTQRPKGVLFFAGATGVGKTELAKSVTSLIFGNETSYIRFDMSEFSREHSDQRLIGAPPGYVGYDVGGELTNAVKQNPFSVILFDEIEKAHPKILDIFLQILDDGRLTSGRGETVYFSESLIIFTSNLGIYEVNSAGEKIQRVNQNMDLDKITSEIQESIEDYFKYKIGRPEILNRIGENIVVFDFIRLETAYKIFDKMLKMVFNKILESHGIVLKIKKEPYEILSKACCLNLSMGGREIGNRLENVLINPLSHSLFENSAKTKDSFIISELIKDEVGWKIKLDK